jgi:type IV pilus assembly protein PilM
MARRLIGLDVGTNAVTIAEVSPGTPPRLDLFAQVALPREAMREGEIADGAAVSEAVSRLRSEVGLKGKVSVRVGIASPRVVVRQVEMPVMTRAELSSALQFQASDLIPISLEDAVLDFAILGESHPGGGGEGGEAREPTMHVMLAAAQEATIMRLVSAVEAGGMQVGAVDLIPLALTRALARPVGTHAPVQVGAGGLAVADDTIGAVGIVSFGGGVTSIAVHEDGVPRFVRVLGSGGRELTDAIARDLEVPPETAEALKRQLGAQSNDEMVARAQSAIDRPLSLLLDEVRSSIDYYRNQPGAARLVNVVVTGGSAQLPGLPERLGALVGVPVEPAYMHDLIRIGDIGFTQDELPRLEPYLPAPVGLALGGGGVGTVIDLLPRTRRSASTSRARPNVNKKIVAAVAAGVVVLGALTFQAHSKASSAKAKASAAETQAEKLKNRLGHLLQAASPAASGSSLQQQAVSLLSGDVGWTKQVGDVGTALPAGVWLTAFQGQHTLSTGIPVAATPTTPGATGTSTGVAPPVAAAGSCAALQQPLVGSVTMSGIAKDLPTLAQFLDQLAKAGADSKGNNPDLDEIWLSNASKGKFGSADVVTFSIGAVLAPGSHSDRLAHYFKEALCK